MVKDKKDRTEFENAFMRASTMLESLVVKELSGKVNCLCLDALNLPPWVRPLEEFCNLAETKGRRLIEVLNDSPSWETHSLVDVFSNVGLLRQYSVGIHGSSATTSYGKTMCSIRLAAHFIQCGIEAKVLSDTKRFLLLSNGTEEAKVIDFEAMGVSVWIVDEWSPGDTSQAQHMSSDMLKVLLSPSAPCSLRCKGSDILTVPANTPRIFTSNSTSGQEWCRTRFTWEYPHMRKCIWFNVKAPLLSTSSRKKTSVELDSNNDALNQVASQRMSAIRSGSSSSS
jgi:hypothetical protein